MIKFPLIVLRSFGIASALFFLFPFVSPAQNAGRVAEWLESYRLSGDFQPVQALTMTQERSDLQNVAGNATVLEADAAALNQILNTEPLTLTFTVPNAYGETFELELVKVDLLSQDFTLGTWASIRRTAYLTRVACTTGASSKTTRIRWWR